MAGGRPSRLSRERIARAALEIVDRDGLDALSMRRLAESLGVGKMTLYGHFRGKDEVLRAVVDAAVVDAGPTSRSHGPWQARLRALFDGAYRNLNAHPALVQLRFREPVLRPEALRFGEIGMRILREAGFGAEEAAGAFRLLFTYVFGFAGLSPEESTERSRRQAAVALAGLPPDDYPELTRAADAFVAAIAGREQFDLGLDIILAGLEARLPREE